MTANAFFIATLVTLSLVLWLMGECRFLVPYRHLLLVRYGGVLALFAGTFFLNVFALVYFVGRKAFLKDTGKKLAHLERQLRSDTTPSEDLSRWLRR